MQRVLWVILPIGFLNNSINQINVNTQAHWRNQVLIGAKEFLSEKNLVSG
jgi:hypothetical protein